MECEDVQAQLADYVGGALPAEAEAEIDRHIASCAACAADRDGFSATWEQLGALPADRVPSDRMRARLEAAIEGFQVRAGAGRRRPAWWLAAAAALLVVGIAIGRQTAPASGDAGPGGDRQIAALRDELRALREMTAMALLQQSSPSERLKGVTWTSRIEEPGAELAELLLDTLMSDPNVSVRLAAIDALRRFGDREVVRRGALEALARQSSPLVQIALIDFAAEVNGGGAADTLRRLSIDPLVNETVRARAAAVLQKVG
jgi:hypothetical protein